MKNLTRVLGELEAKIMEIVWKMKSATVRGVLSKINNGRKKLAYTTVMTVMSRLHEKGLLKCENGECGAYIYSPTQDRETFLANVSKKIINNLVSEYGEVAVAQFVDVIENNKLQDLSKWRKKLKQIR
jgi:predicted transcriptional regulator